MIATRFISRYGRYGMQVRPQVYEAYATGMMKEVQAQVAVQFEIGGLLPEERQYVTSRWRFNGSYQEQDEVTTIEPDYRIGVFDSAQAQRDNQWSDEVREEVERKLLAVAEQFPNDLVAITEVEQPPPWPRYDEYTGSPAALLRKLVDEGHDLERTLAYERKHQNRPKVTEAIEELLNDPEKLAEMQPELEEIVG